MPPDSTSGDVNRYTWGLPGCPRAGVNRRQSTVPPQDSPRHCCCLSCSRREPEDALTDLRVRIVQPRRYWFYGDRFCPVIRPCPTQTPATDLSAAAPVSPPTRLATRVPPRNCERG